MENIIALNAVTTGASAPAAAVGSADALAVVNQIAAAPNLNDGERSALIETTATIDQFITAQPDRAGALASVAGLGLYLRQTATESIPRWNVMTALRSYGLNISENQQINPAPTQEEALAAVRAQLETVARSSRNVSLDTAVAVARVAAPVVQQVVAAAAPAPVKAAPAPSAKVAVKVDTVA